MGGWLIVGGAVAAFDMWAHRTGHRSMSAAYRGAFAAHPFVMGGATVYLVAHLTGWLPRRADLLYMIR